MESEVLISVLVGAVIAVLIFRKLFWRGAKLLVRSALWAAVLTLLAPLGSHIGVALGANGINALILGVLGLPGMGLLLLLNWMTVL